MRGLALAALSLLLGLGTRLPADQADGTLAPWQTVTLFDWCYPGEAAYEAVKQAAAMAGDGGWAAQRLKAGLKLPQASARELAQRLAAQDGLAPELRARLTAAFADEPDQVAGAQSRALSATVQALSVRMEKDSDALDRLEASMARNSYGKGSRIGAVLDLYDGLRLDLPAGLDQGDQHAYMAGGLRSTLSGLVGKLDYQFTVDSEYLYDRLTGQDASSRANSLDAGVSFELPLGSGGLDVNLGSTQNLLLSPLLFASYFPQVPDAFDVDVTDPFRPPKVTKVMDVAYPAGTLNFRGLTVMRQGFSPWWPFSASQFVYTGDTNWWESWSTKFNYMALRLDEDLPWHNRLLDGGLLYGIGSSNGNDLDALVGAGSPLTGPNRVTQQRSSAVGLGGKLHNAWSGTLHFDAAATSYAVGAGATQVTHPGVGWLASLVQPLGAFNLGLDLGAADPWFLSFPHNQAHNQLGAVIDTYQYFGLDGASNAVGDAWTTMIGAPGELSNNTQRAALKLEWHGSWVSLGLYDGIESQLQATDAFVQTTPYLEGNQQDGYGFFRLFGQDFGPVPAPGTVPAGVPASLNMGQHLQGLFNLPTDSVQAQPGTWAQPVAGPAAKVHWQQMSQYNDYESEFTLLLTQGGVGDNRLLAPSAKTLNYAGGSLLLDFAALMGLDLPLQVNLVGELRDLEPQAGLPALDGGSGGLMNQQYLVGTFTGGLSDTLTMLAMAGVETWRSQHSYYPLDIQVMEFGLGFDLKADPVVTGLAFNLRGSFLRLDDMNIGSRQLVLSTVSLGSTLTY